MGHVLGVKGTMLPQDWILPRDAQLFCLEPVLAEKDGQQFVTYLFQYEDYRTKPVVVPKRFSECAELFDALQKRFPVLPLFPSKTLTRSLDKSFIDHRKIELLEFFHRLLFRVDVAKSPLVWSFFGLPASAVETIRPNGPPVVESKLVSTPAPAASTNPFDETSPVETKLESTAQATSDNLESEDSLPEVVLPQSPVSETRERDDSGPEKIQTEPRARDVSLNGITLNLSVKLPLLSVSNATMPDNYTLIIGASESSAIGRLSSKFSTWMRGRPEDPVQTDGSTSPPMGAVYFFRANHDGEAAWTVSLQRYYEIEINDLVWDEQRRWLYVARGDGVMEVLNPSPDFDFVVSVFTHKFADESLSKLIFCPTIGSVIVATASGHISVYNVEAMRCTSTLEFNKGSQITSIQYILSYSTFICFHAPRFDPIGLRLLLGAFDRNIYMYAMSHIDFTGREQALEAQVATNYRLPQPILISTLQEHQSRLFVFFRLLYL